MSKPVLVQSLKDFALQTGFFNSSETTLTAPERGLGSIRKIEQPLKAPFSPSTTENHLRKPEKDPKNSSDKKAENRLSRWNLQEAARLALPGDLVASCYRRRIAPGVDVYRTPEKQTFYKNLLTCKSVWSCPVCSAKISERRKNELTTAVNTWKEDGGQVWLLTQTIRHQKTDSLPFLLDGLSKARRLFKNRKTFKTWSKEIGLFGSVYALEVTHGSNGWHVHTHELLFVKSGQKPAGVRKLRKMWSSACLTAGLPATGVSGVDLQSGDKASSYVSKWGLADELTKSNKKTGKAGSKTPWDFLRNIQKDPYSSSIGLFQDYAKAFKGKSQLTWSKGLKNYFSLEEKTDEQLADEKEKEARIIGAIPSGIWQKICKDKKRGEVLELARSGWLTVQQFILSSYSFNLSGSPDEPLKTDQEEVKPVCSSGYDFKSFDDFERRLDSVGNAS